jgi:hypothetical protein
MDSDDTGTPGETTAGPPPTGDGRVDEAVAALGRLAGRPPEEHVAVLEEVHGRLRDILGELAESQPQREARGVPGDGESRRGQRGPGGDRSPRGAPEPGEPR